MSKTLFNPNGKCNCGVSTAHPVSNCPPKQTKCCLIMCDILTEKNIIPCNQTGTLDITKYITIPSCCDDSPLVLTIPFTSNNLRNVSFTQDVDGNFILEYTSDWSQGKDYKSAKIVYQICCGDILKLQAEVIIPFKQVNKDHADCCGVYNPCNGVCVEAISDEVEAPGVHPSAGETITNPMNDPCDQTKIYGFEAAGIGLLNTGVDPVTGEINYDYDCEVLEKNEGKLTTWVDWYSEVCGVKSIARKVINIDICKNCTGKCDYCTGKCIKAEDKSIEIICGEIVNLDLSISDGEKYYLNITDALFSDSIVTIDENTGLFTLDPSAIDPNKIKFGNYKYPITYNIVCGKIFDTGTIWITFCDLCIGKVPPKDHICNPCTGLFELICPIVTSNSPVDNDNFIIEETKSCDTIPMEIVLPINLDETCDDTPIDPCADIVVEDPCQECKNVNGKPVVGPKCTDKQTCLDGTCCDDTEWLPLANTQCVGCKFEQTSNCGNKRWVEGKKIEVWDESTRSDYCEGVDVPILSNCNNIKLFKGTKVLKWLGVTVDLSKICSDCTVTEFNNCGGQREIAGTRNCDPDCVPDPNSWNLVNDPCDICNDQYVKEVNNCGTIRNSTTLGTKDCNASSCIPMCPDPSTIPCGDIISDGCDGNCPEGTMDCGTCTPTCPDPTTIACGQVVSDGCGGDCPPGTLNCETPTVTNDIGNDSDVGVNNNIIIDDNVIGCTGIITYGSVFNFVNILATDINGTPPSMIVTPSLAGFWSFEVPAFCDGALIGNILVSGTAIAIVTFDCPELKLNIGDPCDDGDNCTSGTTIDSDCNCTGGTRDNGSFEGNCPPSSPNIPISVSLNAQFSVNDLLPSPFNVACSECSSAAGRYTLIPTFGSTQAVFTGHNVDNSPINPPNNESFNDLWSINTSVSPNFTLSSDDMIVAFFSMSCDTTGTPDCEFTLEITIL